MNTPSRIRRNNVFVEGIAKYIKNIFTEGELDENSVCVKSAHTAFE